MIENKLDEYYDPYFLLWAIKQRQSPNIKSKLIQSQFDHSTGAIFGYRGKPFSKANIDTYR